MQLYIESECKESILFVALHPIKNKSVIPMLQLDAIYKAAHVLKEVVRRTDLIYAPQINPESTVYLKPENLQLTGSFKVRGAYYKISQLSDEEKARG
jgi:ilvA_1Cterm: threonine dehydratase